MKVEPEPLQLYTEEQRAAINARVESWLGPPPDEKDMTGTQRMVAWLERQVAFQTIASAMIASGEVLLPGRSGINIMARALKDFPTHVQQLLEIIESAEGKGGTA